MNPNYLLFEQELAELDSKIQELGIVQAKGVGGVQAEIEKLQAKSERLTRRLFSSLTDFDIVQLSRHPQRPYLLDYIPRIFTDFEELSGDRHSGKGSAIIGGIATLDGRSVLVLGHQKGRKTAEKIARNFGMAKPEDYRKALRLMQLAERFHLPILTFIDTAGAYPGREAEQHNQSEAIARNLLVMARLQTPIIVTIIGEGGSGGALGIGVGDVTLMLQYSIYSVIAPEGCAAILWKDSAKAADAANALGVTAPRLKQLGLIDRIIEEPAGGAHRDYDAIAKRLKAALIRELDRLTPIPLDQLVADRYERLTTYGKGSSSA